jgi:hypothetical protein
MNTKSHRGLSFFTFHTLILELNPMVPEEIKFVELVTFHLKTLIDHPKSKCEK